MIKNKLYLLGLFLLALSSCTSSGKQQENGSCFKRGKDYPGNGHRQ